MGGGGIHMLRHTGMRRPNGLLFYQKSLDMGPILVKKILRRGSLSQKLRTNVKSAISGGKEILEMGPDLRKFRKNRKISHF